MMKKLLHFTKKNFLYFSLLLILCGGIASFFLYKNIMQSKGLYQYRCALLAPALHPAMDEIMQGFRERLNQQLQGVEYKEYNANGNKTLLRSQVEEIEQGSFDLVFTIGTFASQLMHEVLVKRASTMPHVFTAVDDPVEKGIIQSLKVPGDTATGIISATPFNQQVDVLLKLKPKTTAVLLVYDPAHPSNEIDKKELQKLFASKGITFKSVEIMHSNELGQKVPPFLDGIDTVLVLKDHIILMGLDLLIRFCEERNITLYCSDLNSADRGAALAFGVHEYEYGSYGADVAYHILKEKKNPGTIPVAVITEQHAKLNTKTMRKQGLDLSEEQILTFVERGGLLL
jgi:putative tryptophan/tyrosine transport system substrate-binding protein